MVESHRRKSNRLSGYDYSQNGAYFVTICTQNRSQLLGHFSAPLRSISVGDGFPVPHFRPTRAGEVVAQLISEIPLKYNRVTVDSFVIMPNHVHLLLAVSDPQKGTGNPSPTLGAVIGWFKYQTTRHINTENATVGAKIWQRSYHDHVIRNADEYNRVAQYIDNNPATWQDDMYYN